MFSELLYAGKTLREIAGMSARQLHNIVFRARDQNGKLRRWDPNALPEELRDSIDERGMRIVRRPTSFAKMFKEVAQYQGKNAEIEFERFRQENPKYGRMGRM